MDEKHLCETGIGSYVSVIEPEEAQELGHKS
jgi:hypothetical protein